jgi:hypothetical protein
MNLILKTLFNILGFFFSLIDDLIIITQCSDDETWLEGTLNSPLSSVITQA